MRSGAIAGLAAILLLATTAAGQAPSGHRHGGQAGHRHTPGDDGEAHRRVDAYLKEFDAVVADGRGFGLAFAADQHGYPGPLHVLELKDQLQLTPEQETRMRALFETMLGAARAELRLAHLAAHLQARDVLSEAQRRAYHRLRWGALPARP